MLKDLLGLLLASLGWVAGLLILGIVGLACGGIVVGVVLGCGLVAGLIGATKKSAARGVATAAGLSMLGALGCRWCGAPELSLLGAIGMGALAMIPAALLDGRPKCPACRARVDPEAVVCHHCRANLADPFAGLVKRRPRAGLDGMSGLPLPPPIVNGPRPPAQGDAALEEWRRPQQR